jgi:hypothetical protein
MLQLVLVQFSAELEHVMQLEAHFWQRFGMFASMNWPSGQVTAHVFAVNYL